MAIYHRIYAKLRASQEKVDSKEIIAVAGEARCDQFYFIYQYNHAKLHNINREGVMCGASKQLALLILFSTIHAYHLSYVCSRIRAKSSCMQFKEDE